MATPLSKLCLHRPAGEYQYKKDAERYFKESLRETGGYDTQELGEQKPVTAMLMAQVSQHWGGAGAALPAV